MDCTCVEDKNGHVIELCEDCAKKLLRDPD